MVNRTQVLLGAIGQAIPQKSRERSPRWSIAPGHFTEIVAYILKVGLA
ncbi:hypothetical protein H6F46_15580 [Limnothrix sp. FACHB-1083]|nr:MULTISPECIES: hypothetical protein [unclassified Limnothrix]MBD2162115.1 hypothetical protein [Limnothrix sp. FACHB-1083]MBD2193007.1 hypothetical protein [Limnothrix sp. FACHB-1088]